MEAVHRYNQATTTTTTIKFLTYNLTLLLLLISSNVLQCQHKVLCFVVIPTIPPHPQRRITVPPPPHSSSTILLHASSSSSSSPSPSSSPSSPPLPPSSSSSSSSSASSSSRRNRRNGNTNTRKHPPRNNDDNTPPPPPPTTKTPSSQYLIKRKSVAVGTDPLLSLNINLDSLAKSSQQPESARRAEELLLRIEKLYEDGYYQTRPDTVSYNSVMNAYARALEMEVQMADGRDEEGGGGGVVAGLENVLRILKRMEDLSNITTTTELNDQTYNQITTETTTPDHDECRNRSVMPTIITWNTVLRSLAKHGYGQQAEQVLQHLESNYKSSASASTAAAAPKFSQRNQPIIRPDTITYNSVIDAYANAHQPEDAERILRRLMTIPQSSDYHLQLGEEEVKADTVSFNTVLHAWALSRRGRDGAVRAQNLVRHMEKLYHAGNLDVKPDVVSYTAVMAAWVVSSRDGAGGGGKKKGGREVEGETKALELLHQCEQRCALGDSSVCPNRITYTVVINAMARSGGGGAADRAHEVLRRLERMYYQSGRQKGGVMQLDDALRPDRKTYTSVIEAYARSGREDSGEMAVEILERMISLSEELGGGSGGGVDDVGPDTKTYVSVLVALGKSRARGAADVAQRLLDDMEDLYYASDGGSRGRCDVVPNTVAFNAVIDAWGRSSFRFKAERANALLRRMEVTQEDRRRSRLSVSTDDDPDGSRSRRQQQRQRPVLNLKPDIITYNSVLNAAATSFGDQRIKYKALKIATDAYRTVQTSANLKPTSLTYSIYAKAVRKLIDDEDQRERFLPKIFTACVRDGMVNDYVLNQFEMSYRGNSGGGGSISKERYGKLLTSMGYCSSSSAADGDGGGGGGEWPVTMKSIPEEWKRNTQRRR